MIIVFAVIMVIIMVIVINYNYFQLVWKIILIAKSGRLLIYDFIGISTFNFVY